MRQHHADLDCDREVDEDGEKEGDQQHGDVTLWRRQLGAEDAPFTHLVGDH
jgi:hypothetical protein